MKTKKEFLKFAIRHISNSSSDYVVIDFVELTQLSEKKGILVHESADGGFTTIGYYDKVFQGDDHFGHISCCKEGEYAGDGWDHENDRPIPGFYIISVNEYSFDEYSHLLENDWSDALVRAADGEEVGR